MDAAALGPAAAPRRRRLTLLTWSVLAVVWGLDQATKALAVAHLSGREPVPVVDGLLQLRLLYNPGAAFSFATGLTWLLTVVAVVVVVVVVRMSRRTGSVAWALALGLLLAGATGNLTDRLLREPGFARGHVVDFIEWPGFPVFNVADAAITCAAVLIVVLSLRGVPLDGGDRTTPADSPDRSARG